MNPRTTAMLFVAAVALGAFIFLYEMDDLVTEPEADAERGLLLAGVSPSAIDWISLPTTDGRRAELRRTTHGWEMTSPVRFPADTETVDAVVRQLTELFIEGTVSAAGASPSDFGLVGRAGDAGEILFEHAGTNAGFRIGRATPVGSSTYVQEIGESGIEYVATWRINGLLKSSVELRERKLIDFDRVGVERLRVSWLEGRVGLERRNDGWWLVEPVQERADPDTLERLFSDLAFLQADGFVDEEISAEALGLTRPELEISLAGRDAEGAEFSRSFALGGSREGLMVASGQGGAVYLVAPQRLEDFPRTVVAYRFKTLTRFEVADARRFELAFTRSDSEATSEPEIVTGVFDVHDWQTQPVALDPAAVSGLLAQLARLDARDIFADALGEAERAALGLSPPLLAVRVFDTEGALLADVRFGRLLPGRGLLAMRAGSEQLLLVDSADASPIPLSREALVEALAPQVDDEPVGEATDADAPGI